MNRITGASLLLLATLVAITPAYAVPQRDNNIDMAIATLNQQVTTDQGGYTITQYITNALIPNESGVGHGIINPSAYYAGYSFESVPIRAACSMAPCPIIGYNNWVSA